MAAIVSNNSASAVRACLTAHRLADHVAPVIGRDDRNPGAMKPRPGPIMRALAVLHAEPGTAVMIGDGTSDILSARAAGTRSIGFANKPGKAQRFTEAGADVTVYSMAEVAEALLASIPLP